MHIPQTLRTTVLASTFALVASVLVTQVMIQGMGVQMASLHGGNSGAGYCGNYVVEAFLGEECDEGDQNGVPGMDCSDRCEMTEDFDDLDDLDIEGDTTGIGDIGAGIGEDPLDDDATSEQETPLQRSQDHKDWIEEMRRRRQEIQDRIEAKRRNDRENANRERDERETRRDEEGQLRSDLLCYDKTGELTDDREKCDKDQSQFLHSEKLDDTVAKDFLRKKFQGDNVAEKHRAHLIATMQDARVRLQDLLASNNHRDDVTVYFNESINWLDRGITYFSEGPKSNQEIQQMVAPVKQLLSQAKVLVQQEKKLPSEPVDINPIIAKTERLLLKFRESFVALANGGVELDQDALTAYVDAAGQFVEIRSACAEDEMQCGQLNNVLEKLKEVQGPILEAFGKYPEIYEAVQAKFAE